MSKPDDHHPIIIIKRVKPHEEEHHGGAWKIAFADFMTAMMAFFLVLWIINATDKNTKTLIARYFNPVRVEEPARATKGIHKADPSGGAQSDPAAQDAGSPSGKQIPTKPSGSKVAPEAGPSTGPDNHLFNPAAPTPTMPESDLFADPRKSLDQIVSSANVQEIKNAVARSSTSLDAFRDPFNPGYQERIEVKPGSNGHDAAEAAGPIPVKQKVDTLPPSSAQSHVDLSSTKANREDVPISGGPSDTQVESSRRAGPSAPPSSEPASVSKLLAQIRRDLGPTFDFRLAPAIDVKATREGVLISLTDQSQFSMFALGSAEPQPNVIRLVDAIGKALRARSDSIVIRGFTDGRPYRSKTYDNWRLSSARAQMVFYMLTRGGLSASRVERIEGYADRLLKDPNHPFAAVNRRIEILLQEPAR